MIRINLLPTELRKGQRTTDPHLIGTIAACIAAAIALGLWTWLQTVSLPGAKDGLERLNKALVIAKAEAADVISKEAELAELKDHRDYLARHMNMRMNWAKTLNDLVDLIVTPKTFSIPGYEVGLMDLSVATNYPNLSAVQAQGGNRNVQQPVTATLKVRFKLVGDINNMAGNYIDSFFFSINRSTWWVEHGFQDKAEQVYAGDTPRPNDKIKKVVIDMPLEFNRTGLAAPLAVLPASRSK